ncbi:CCAAT-HAP2 transcription factor [Citrus sinensis]|uniref:nuclear transcription factor Y subunit A-1-like isoform X1 n=1 Tax=Citrus sinensis TaxID=2711 RepID=UPI0021949E7D|nr:nuclear transcription factor Y subunit A-1-like isoform X1 [Citrus sinensis]XP_006489921.2 nuclear transcription factor Y subunit A-1-like isoform X1 [Citrus sinensis]XP_006489922.2 nuclear transcription factor Y subunit A-1-like isoform X1 [Citrus sinensis]KAH9648199.1 CCAAT-HAP2 transcription factor [Citrus sinensis]
MLRSMHQNKSSNSSGPEANSNNSFTISSQPWWRGVGHDSTSRAMLQGGIGNISSPREPINGVLVAKTSKSQVNSGMDGGADATKEMLMSVASQADGKFGGQQPSQHSVSLMHPQFSEYLTQPSQLELVGHSIACASYPYSDSYYGGAVPAYGQQALVHPQSIGVHSARMALPLEMAEEPVYVNAKQYHGILRRRQLRAKAELERKLIKVRKPYLHESRHLHAMRRARGCGGRFVNTKKLDSQTSNGTVTNGTSSNVAVSTLPPNSSSSESVATNYSRGTADSSTGCREVTEPQVHKMQQQQRCSNGNGQTYYEGNGNGCYSHHQGFQLFKYHSLPDNKVEEGDFSRQQSGRIVENRAQHRALTIK